MKRFVLLLLTLALVSPAQAGDWPQWRGPHFNGSSDERNLPSQWSKTDNIAWTADLAGEAASTPVVCGNHVFLTGVDAANDTLLVMAFDRTNGKRLWQHEVAHGTRKDKRSNFAAPSPVTDGRTVIFFFGNGDLAAFDADGARLWARNLQKDLGVFRFGWTFSSSPLWYDGKLYMQILQRDVAAHPEDREEGKKDSFLLALDPQTGKTLWRAPRPSQAVAESREAFTTPIPYDDGTRRQLLIAGGDALTGHDPATGKELWRWGTWNPQQIGHWRLVVSPVAGSGVALACAPKREPVYAIKTNGSGLLDDRAVAWVSREAKEITSDVPTPAFYDGDFFVLSDVRKNLARVEPRTGKVKWSVPTPGRAKYEASPLAADGKIYCINFDGQVALFDAANGRLLRTIAMDEPTNGEVVRASIIAAHGQLYIRTTRKLYCVGKEQAEKPSDQADFVLTGSGWSLARLADGDAAFSNRSYVWRDVPKAFQNWRITRTAGGDPAEIRVTTRRDTALFVVTTSAQTKVDLAGWTAVPDTKFHYSDMGRTPMTIYSRPVKAGQEIVVPQGNWTGVLVLVPPEATVSARSTTAVLEKPLDRVKHNHPGLGVDLGVGLWAWPLPMDFDGDGDLDLVVDCPDKPYNGTYFFENATGDTAKNAIPVFKPGRRISKGLQNVQVSYVEGRPRVLSPGFEYPDFLKSGLEKGVKLPLAANVHPKPVRGNFWRYVDFDGDGRLDLVIGADDWTAYGWDNAYDANGVWTRGPLRGFVYVARNTGANAEPKYEKPVQLLAGDKPVETFGWPSPNFADFDGDGDLDLICGEFRDSFTYFENVGTRQSPRYAPGRLVKTPDGKPLLMDLEMITPVAVDWNKDGRMDLIVGDEDGRVAFVENTGKLDADRTPVFLAPRYFQQEADELKCGALATPVGVDWDGDGDIDIVSGNSAGYIMFFENLSGRGVEKPKWAAPKYLEADGKPIRIMAGPNGSIQGPCEAKWGYTTLSVADWDGDGLPDLVVNSIWGKVVWFKNLGPRNAPKLAAARPVEVEWDGPQPTLAYGWLRPQGKELLTQWRTTPVVVDWNRDGLADLVMLDHEGYLALFERARRDGQLVLLPPKRVFCDERGTPLRLNAGVAGRSGRRKLCIVDWDGDGKLDILVNAANARLLRQVAASDGRWQFRDVGPLSTHNIEGHDVSPTVVDFNADGIPDFLGGAEDGRFYYLKNPRSK